MPPKPIITTTTKTKMKGLCVIQTTVKTICPKLPKGTPPCGQCSGKG
jgi:hypothetical protein